MPQPVLTLPDSLSWYFGDRANRSALNLIMDNRALPQDLGWDEVLAYHDAKLAAQKVRTDYCAFLHRLWQRTWGAAIARLLPDAPPFTAGDLGEWAPTLDTVWSDSTIYGKADLPHGRTLWAAVEFPDDRTISLVFYADDGNGDCSLSDTLPLSDAWQEADEANWRRTARSLCTVAGGGADHSALAEAAQEAVSLLVRALTKPESMR